MRNQRHYDRNQNVAYTHGEMAEKQKERTDLEKKGSLLLIRANVTHSDNVRVWVGSLATKKQNTKIIRAEKYFGDKSHDYFNYDDCW